MKNLQNDLEPAGEQMTLFSQVDFPANHTALQESGSEKTTLDTSGRKCLESFQKLSRHGSWAKTFAALLVGTGEWYSTKCNLTWKLSATKSSRLYFQLAPSTPRIDATGFGLLPTVRTSDCNSPGMHGTGGQDLRTVVAFGLLKTPTTSDAYSENLTKKEQRMGNSGTLAQEIQTGFVENRWPGLLPTPTAASDAKGGCTRPDSKRQNDTLAHAIHGQVGTPGQTSQLNPLFVAEMMGFPPNWLELPFLNTETNQSKPTETQ